MCIRTSKCGEIVALAATPFTAFSAKWNSWLENATTGLHLKLNLPCSYNIQVKWDKEESERLQGQQNTVAPPTTHRPS